MIGARIIRLEADVAARVGTQMKDALTSASPEIWHGNDADVQLAVLRNGAIENIARLTSIRLTVLVVARTGTPLIDKIVTMDEFDSSLNAASWSDGSKQHVTIPLTAAETSLTIPDGSNQATFWLVVSALTNDAPAKEITLGGTILTVVVYSNRILNTWKVVLDAKARETKDQG
jgi:hypothetical protein